MIIRCSCDNKFMDDRYGKGRRVANKTERKNGGSADTYRCVNCLKETQVGGGDNAHRR